MYIDGVVGLKGGDGSFVKVIFKTFLNAKLDHIKGKLVFKTVENLYSKGDHVITREIMLLHFWLIDECIFKVIRDFALSLSRIRGQTIGIPRTIYVQRMVETDHPVPPSTVGEQAPVNNEGVGGEPILLV